MVGVGVGVGVCCCAEILIVKNTVKIKLLKNFILLLNSRPSRSWVERHRREFQAFRFGNSDSEFFVPKSNLCCEGSRRISLRSSCFDADSYLPKRTAKDPLPKP